MSETPGGRLSGLVAHLRAQKVLSSEEIASLRRLVAELDAADDDGD